MGLSYFFDYCIVLFPLGLSIFLSQCRLVMTNKHNKSVSAEDLLFLETVLLILHTCLLPLLPHNYEHDTLYDEHYILANLLLIICLLVSIVCFLLPTVYPGVITTANKKDYLRAFGFIFLWITLSILFNSITMFHLVIFTSFAVVCFWSQQYYTTMQQQQQKNQSRSPSRPHSPASPYRSPPRSPSSSRSPSLFRSRSSSNSPVIPPARTPNSMHPQPPSPSTEVFQIPRLPGTLATSTPLAALQEHRSVPASPEFSPSTSLQQ